MQHKTPPPTTVRLRRTRTDIRQALLESALAEFGAKGFDGASTRAIARRVQAHQPQINYHFESKTALWTAAVDYLFGLLREAFDGVIPAQPTQLVRPLIKVGEVWSCPHRPSTALRGQSSLSPWRRTAVRLQSDELRGAGAEEFGEQR
jgi:AcrR family transcriptional regulator